MNTQTPPPPHPVPADFEKFLASCTPAEKRLHEQGQQILGSSQFPEKSHHQKAWKASQGAGAKVK